MKKVLIFSVAYLPFVGGAEIAVKEITDRISDVEFHMLTVNLDGRQPKEEKIGNVFVHRIGSGTKSKFLFPFSAFSRARALMRTVPFDATWSIMASQASIAASFVKMFSPALPLVLTVQEGDEESHLRRYAFGSRFLYRIFIQPWHHLVFYRADHITAISTHLAERSRMLNAAVPIDVIPNGVDTEVFSREVSDAELEAACKEMGKGRGDRMLITTSRLVKKNGVKDLIAAMAILPNSVKLAVIGTGELESELRALVDRLKLGHRISLLGQKNYSDIPKYLQASDIFIRPSLSEGMGNSFIEAMAAGIPVIATPVGGIPDFLKEGETGLFCRPQNPQSIAQAVSKLIESPDLRQRLVINAEKLVREKYGWNAIARDMRQVFDTLE